MAMSVPPAVIQDESAVNTPLAASPLLPMVLFSIMKSGKNGPYTKENFNDTYDYIIVGGGSAGSVLAGRLSEKSCVSVLLLEAGGDPPLLTEVPATERSFFGTRIDWAFTTVPQQYMGGGLVNNQVLWKAGKVLGGSSVFNDVQYSRGNKKDYDNWEKTYKATGWSYKDVLPYFKKLEDNQNPNFVKKTRKYHGFNGPITMGQPNYTAEFKKPLMDTAKKMGYKFIDVNGPKQTGFYDLQGTLRNGQLCSAAKGYMVPASNRSNLVIVSHAFVRKILFDGQRASGVEVDFEGQTRVVNATKEIIISAGTVNTAKLLMLSGIGPSDELKKFGIKPISKLNVGQNLQDPVGAHENYVVNPKKQPPLAVKFGDQKNVHQYIKHRSGIYSSAQLVTLVAYLQNNISANQHEVPVQVLYFLELNNGLPLTEFNLKPQVYNQIYGKYENSSYISCFVQLINVRSKGTVTLKSTDPYDDPVIDPQYYKDPQDVQDVVEGLKKCRLLYGSDLMVKELGAQSFDTLVPGCEHLQNNTDAYLTCQVKQVSFSYYHAAGTAKMGDPKDSTTVVDPQLRVKGVKSLRVVDASIMPKIVSGPTNIPVIMIAEKASDMIKAVMGC